MSWDPQRLPALHPMVHLGWGRGGELGGCTGVGCTVPELALGTGGWRVPSAGAESRMSAQSRCWDAQSRTGTSQDWGVQDPGWDQDQDQNQDLEGGMNRTRAVPWTENGTRRALRTGTGVRTRRCQEEVQSQGDAQEQDQE